MSVGALGTERDHDVRPHSTQLLGDRILYGRGIDRIECAVRKSEIVTSRTTELLAAAAAPLHASRQRRRARPLATVAESPASPRVA
jgi:hypothetical protein